MSKNILKETLYYLDKYHLRAKKKFGQNFLIDANILSNIVEKSQIKETDLVIEVGPGLGNLTRFIAKKAAHVDCYEIDKDMVQVLKESLKDDENVKVYLQDILEADLSIYKGQDVHVVANLPYYITTAILFKFLESDISVKSFTLMMQKEVATRIASKPSTKDYNALSVILQYKTKPEILFNVSKEVFIPKPAVDSTVISLTVKEGLLSKTEEERFIKTTKLSFTQRRKTLLNNLSSGFDLPKEVVTNVITELGYDTNVRAESLSLDDFLKLSVMMDEVSRETSN